ncbi:MAG: CheR family methyltransferase [Bdellovibrionia bacterium]
MSSAAATVDLQQKLVEEASAHVSKVTGIQLGTKQAAMVQARLSKRMLELKMTAEQYLTYFRQNVDKESPFLISLLTTHHTFFFREFVHFEFLTQSGLKAVTDSIRAQGRKTLRVWSAACSWGHEVYSLSMHLSTHLKEVAPDFTYEILGTDVDSESVAISRNGVYKWDEVKGIPADYLSTHWARGTGEISAFVKAKKNIKDPCKFDVKNLTELHREANPQKFDIVFCRNVLIYFNQEQIQQIAKELLRRLEPHGFLFLGISESLMGMDLPVTFGGPSIYVHKQAEASATAQASTKASTKASTLKAVPSVGGAPKAPTTSVSAVEAAPAPAVSKTIRLLCVDDSPVVLTLLKKIFAAEPGFEVVATAKNGIEAAEMLKKHKVDALTLDIHMPEQNGLEYLQKNFGTKHPPVIMVTSVSREDSQLGVKCLENGARDFVEKPGLNNLEEKGEELRMKVRCAVRAPAPAGAGLAEVAKSFSRSSEILNPGRKLRTLVCGLSDREKLVGIIKENKGVGPATLILVHGAEAMLDGLVTNIASASGVKPQIWDGKSPITSGVYIADFGKAVQSAKQVFGGRRISIMLLGDVTQQISGKVSEWVIDSKAQLILEEGASFSKAHSDLRSIASDSIPVTGFLYTANVYLSRDV